MTGKTPAIYSISAHRGFADALVAGLVPRYEEPRVGLANLTLLLPSTRAARTVSEAFIRYMGEQERQGLLMPRMAMIGDLDLDESLGALLDPLGEGDIPPAVEPTRRWLVLADIIAEVMSNAAPQDAMRLRLARDMAATIDRLLVERVPPEELVSEKVINLLATDVQSHWQQSLRHFVGVHDRWMAWLAEHGLVDASERRNQLFDRAAKRWRDEQPATPIVAAGVTSAAPALAKLLRVVSELPNGAVILPDFDLTMSEEVWDELGRAGNAPEPGDTPFARGDAVTHPQYHLKLLLNRMGIAREEVQPWHRKGMGAAPPERSHAIGSLFLPPEASKSWVDLPASKRRMAGVRLMTNANPEAEAQAVALMVREAVAEPERRVALVTPDRGLARRVVHHLRRWHITADDTAGIPLSKTPAGRFILSMAKALATDASPVELLALLQHPFVSPEEDRRTWLRRTRELEMALRGPRIASGLDQISDRLRKLVETKDRRIKGVTGLPEWWDGVAQMLEPIFRFAQTGDQDLGQWISLLSQVGEQLCGVRLWSREDGRALSAFVEDLRLHAGQVGANIGAEHLGGVLNDAMENVAVRPPYGGHPRIAIYGLLEARMSRADLVICAGLNEGVWPQGGSADGLLAPAILRELGVPGADFRIGLAAHDLAGALGAPEVVLSRAERDESGPTIPSRFLLRAEALLGEIADQYREDRIPKLAEALDTNTASSDPYQRPAPNPDADQRDVAVSVTALDRLRGDPFQFYAAQILQLADIDGLDADPSPAWMGSLAHEILEKWHAARQSEPAATINPIAGNVLQEMRAHPLTVALWKPRLLAALNWIEQSVRADEAGGRSVVAWECWGEMAVDGVRVHGRADRIDRLPDGTLAIVDYKTGKPPSASMVEEGFALQLGLLGLMAGEGGFKELPATPASGFEYWSLGKSPKSDTGFGYVETPLKVGNKRTGLPPEEFLPKADEYLRDAISRWIKGREPFTAKLNPNFPGYDTYDQLMRLGEWQARSDDEAGQ